MADKRYQAPQNPYEAPETNKFGSAMGVSETFYDNLRKAAEEREKTSNRKLDRKPKKNKGRWRNR